MPEGSDKQIEKPRCIAIVICNEIIEDKRTNSKTLVSLFNQIYVHALPATHPRMFIFGSFSEGRGEWPIGFRISDPEDKEIMKVEGQAKFIDPLGVLDIVFEVRGLPIKRDGAHFVDVVIGGKQEVGRRFNVSFKKEE